MDSDSKVEHKDEKEPGWLRELQLKSWEPEILLSGIVLYGMFKTPELLDQALVYLKVNFYGVTTDFDNLIAILKVAIYWLTFGLILHLISRGIWVGMVGLSFTFPKGINYDKLKLSPKFKKALDRIPSIQKIIISLEKLCSSLFSISFMLFMCMIGGYLYFLVTLIIPVVLYFFLIKGGEISELEGIIMAIYVFAIGTVAIIGLLDFLSLGYLKRIKWLSRIYYPLYRFLSVLTLSRFYRPIYYSIVSNYNRWKISAFLVVFVGISIFMVVNTSGIDTEGGDITRISMWSNRMGSSAFVGYYDDQYEDNFSLSAHIQSDIIRGNTLRLFVVSRADREESIREYCNYDSLQTELDTASVFVDLYCLSEFYHVYIDDSLYNDLKWKFHYKNKTRQKGILTWINVRQLDEGLHHLSLRSPGESSMLYAQIPFYKEFTPTYYLPEVRIEEDQDRDSYLKLKPVLPK